MTTRKTSRQRTKKSQPTQEQLLAEARRKEIETKEQESAERLEKLAHETFIPKIKELCANPAEAEIELRWMEMLLDGAVKREITRLLSEMKTGQLDLFGGTPKEQAEIVERLKLFQGLIAEEGVEHSARFLKTIIGFINNSRVAATKDLTWNDITLEIPTGEVADKPAS